MRHEKGLHILSFGKFLEQEHAYILYNICNLAECVIGNNEEIPSVPLICKNEEQHWVHGKLQHNGRSKKKQNYTILNFILKNYQGFFLQFLCLLQFM